jgi:hypothetical protein
MKKKFGGLGSDISEWNRVSRLVRDEGRLRSRGI